MTKSSNQRPYDAIAWIFLGKGGFNASNICSPATTIFLSLERRIMNYSTKLSGRTTKPETNHGLMKVNVHFRHWLRRKKIYNPNCLVLLLLPQLHLVSKNWLILTMVVFLIRFLFNYFFFLLDKINCNDYGGINYIWRCNSLPPNETKRNLQRRDNRLW